MRMFDFPRRPPPFVPPWFPRRPGRGDGPGHRCRDRDGHGHGHGHHHGHGHRLRARVAFLEGRLGELRDRTESLRGRNRDLIHALVRVRDAADAALPGRGTPR